MNSFDDREHRRAKRRRAAKLKRTCRPWIYSPSRLYHYVMWYVRSYRRRHPYCREVKQSEADRSFERFTDWRNGIQDLAFGLSAIITYFYGCCIILVFIIMVLLIARKDILLDFVSSGFGYQSFDDLLFDIGYVS